VIAPPDYDREEKTARLANAEELRNDINSPSVVNKIASWAARNSLEPEFVRFKVLTDDTFALHFAKDPGRQSLHQKVAARHIRDVVPLVEQFKALSAGGPDAEYVVNGMVVNGAAWKNIQGDGKSIDFRWSLTRGGKTFTVYATHKHTKDEGGSQDNQYADVRLFLEAAQRCTDPNVLFIAICDGPYYLRAAGTGLSRLAELSSNYGRRRVRACNIAALPALYSAALCEWAEFAGVVLSTDDEAKLQMMRE
jgi:hypothetical protein